MQEAGSQQTNRYRTRGPRSTRLKTISFIALCVIFLSLAGSAISGSSRPNKGIVSRDTTDGAEIYRITCSVCHGERGDGDSFAGRVLNPPPKDFTDPEVIKVLTREKMRSAVENGRPKSAMEPFKGQLTSVQIDAAIDYVRSTFMNAHEEEAKGTEAAGMVQGGDITLGRKIYNFRCYMCHGYGGDAHTRAARELNPPPRDFTDTDQMRGLDAQVMFEAVKYGREGTAMQPFQRLLSDREIQSAVAFIQYAFIARKAENIRYHSADNQWVDFDKKYPWASRYLRYEGDDSNLPEELKIGKQTFEVACVTCHLPKKRPSSWREGSTWRRETGD